MKRRSVHLAFALLTAGAAAATVVQGIAFQRAQHQEAAVVGLLTGSVDPNDPGDDVQGRAPAVALARAMAAATAGDEPAAIAQYSRLAEQEDAGDALRDAALYNLANLYLRQALRSESGGISLPLVELAKQRYRDLLRRSPKDADTRNNLALALRLAPESPADFLGDNEVVERRRMRLPGMSAVRLP